MDDGTRIDALTAHIGRTEFTFLTVTGCSKSQNAAILRASRLPLYTIILRLQNYWQLSTISYSIFLYMSTHTQLRATILLIGLCSCVCNTTCPLDTSIARNANNYRNTICIIIINQN